MNILSLPAKLVRFSKYWLAIVVRSLRINTKHKYHLYNAGILIFVLNVLVSAKKSGLKNNARTAIWIYSLREKAIAIESMLHKLQSLTITLKRKQQLAMANAASNCSAIGVAAAIATCIRGGKTTNATSFSSSMDSSASTKR